MNDSARTEIEWFDSHCHLDGEEDPATVVADAAAAGVVGMVTVGTDGASSAVALELARSIGRVWATAGVHPHEAEHGVERLQEVVAEAVEAADGRLVAIGECGLDYHYDHSPREAQRRVFAEQVEMAHRFDLPLVIHTREAWSDTFAVLREQTVPDRTVFHCFTGGPEEAMRCVDLGAHLSISGIVSFRNATDLRSAVACVPLDRLMVETDSPYLTPVPFRGRRNRPEYVRRVGEELAAVLGRRPEEVAASTTEAARRFFGMRSGGPVVGDRSPTGDV